jgi:hypothetical protein
MLELLLVCAMLGAVVIALVQPLRSPASASAPVRGGVAALEAARDTKLREIHDAELDRLTGKLSEADHAAIDARLRAEAVELLRRIDVAREEAV